MLLSSNYPVEFYTCLRTSFKKLKIKNYNYVLSVYSIFIIEKNYAY